MEPPPPPPPPPAPLGNLPRYFCEICGKHYSRNDNRLRHLYHSHGIQSTRRRRSASASSGWNHSQTNFDVVSTRIGAVLHSRILFPTGHEQSPQKQARLIISPNEGISYIHQTPQPLIPSSAGRWERLLLPYVSTVLVGLYFTRCSLLQYDPTLFRRLEYSRQVSHVTHT